MLTLLSSAHMMQFMQHYGLWGLLTIIMLESMGLPLPGEAMLIGMAVYAGTSHNLTLLSVILVASVAAIIGDNIGFLLGRVIGTRLLQNYGKYIFIDSTRLQIGEYLFLRHGGKIVFFGRFIALLRALAAFLAGANHMPWRTFLLMNALGGVTWASLFGSAAYFFGDKLFSLDSELRLAILCSTILFFICSYYFFRHHEKELAKKAANYKICTSSMKP